MPNDFSQKCRCPDNLPRSISPMQTAGPTAPAPALTSTSLPMSRGPFFAFTFPATGSTATPAFAFLVLPVSGS